MSSNTDTCQAVTFEVTFTSEDLTAVQIRDMLYGKMERLINSWEEPASFGVTLHD